MPGKNVRWHHEEYKLRHKGKVHQEMSEKIEFMIFFSFIGIMMGLVLIIFFLPAVFLPMLVVSDTLDTLPRYDPWEVITGGNISGYVRTGDLQVVDVRNEAAAFVLAGLGFALVCLYSVRKLERLLDVSLLKLLKIDWNYMLRKSKFRRDYKIISALVAGSMFLATAFVAHTFFLVGFTTTSIILNLSLILCLLAFLLLSYRLKLNIFEPDSRMAKLLTRGK